MTCLPTCLSICSDRGQVSSPREPAGTVPFAGLSFPLVLCDRRTAWKITVAGLLLVPRVSEPTYAATHPATLLSCGDRQRSQISPTCVPLLVPRHMKQCIAHRQHACMPATGCHRVLGASCEREIGMDIGEAKEEQSRHDSHMRSFAKSLLFDAWEAGSGAGGCIMGRMCSTGGL